MASRGAPPKKDRKEYNEAQELENLQRVFDRLDKKGDKKVRRACAVSCHPMAERCSARVRSTWTSSSTI